MESTDPQPADQRPPPVGSVWVVYKSRFWPTQAFIAICCGLMYLAFGMKGITVIASWIFLQFASLYGAWTGKKLADRLNGHVDD